MELIKVNNPKGGWMLVNQKMFKEGGYVLYSEDIQDAGQTPVQQAPEATKPNKRRGTNR